MIGPILPEHYPAILDMNAEFVHWLAPLDEAGLVTLINLATYARQVADGEGVLLGFSHDSGHMQKNIKWLSERFDAFYYIDRIIIAANAQGKGHARALYEDFEALAHKNGSPRLVCEVNTKPDNPGSHRFHLNMGFQPIADVDYPAYDAAVRYYEKALI